MSNEIDKSLARLKQKKTQITDVRNERESTAPLVNPQIIKGLKKNIIKNEMSIKLKT